MVVLELRKSTSKNDRLFIICSSDGEVVSSEGRNDSFDRNSIRSLDSERDDNSSTVSVAKSDKCIYHDASMSSVEVTLHEPHVGTPQTSTCSSGFNDYSRVWKVNSLDEDEYLHDLSMEKHDSSCKKCRNLESNVSSHKSRESFENKIKRLSRPTKSFVSYLAEGPKITKEESSEHQDKNVRVYNNYTFIKHLSRPTKAYLSYLSQGPTGTKSREPQLLQIAHRLPQHSGACRIGVTKAPTRGIVMRWRRSPRVSEEKGEWLRWSSKKKI